MVLYCAGDLIWASRIKATAESVGVACRPARDLAMLEARLGDSPVVGVLIDLDAGERAFELIQRLRGEHATQRDRVIRIVAWGPHVDGELLERASVAGADEVLVRGVFDRRLAAILQAFGPPPGL